MVTIMPQREPSFKKEIIIVIIEGKTHFFL